MWTVLRYCSSCSDGQFVSTSTTVPFTGGYNLCKTERAEIMLTGFGFSQCRFVGHFRQKFVIVCHKTCTSLVPYFIL